MPYAELPCALLYFTGSAYFNRSMRSKANDMVRGNNIECRLGCTCYPAPLFSHCMLAWMAHVHLLCAVCFACSGNVSERTCTVYRCHSKGRTEWCGLEDTARADMCFYFPLRLLRGVPPSSRENPCLYSQREMCSRLWISLMLSRKTETSRVELYNFLCMTLRNQLES